MKPLTRIIQKELRYGAHNYNPAKVCIKKAKRIYMYDIYDKKYFDFLSCYSAVNQGHCHPEIISSLNEQSKNLTLTSRAFYNDKLGEYMEFTTKLFGYDRLLPMNTGVEAGETAIKLARAWGYQVKKVMKNEAVILFAKNNFWGRTISACSSSTDPSCYTNFGPFTPGFELIEYNNLLELESKLKTNPNIVAYMFEPIQGEAGIIIPDSNYIYKVKKLCEKYNVLTIVDEVQTGLGRTGKLLDSDYNKIKPDILCLGKALSGGVLPVSAVLADTNIMNCISPGTHGSTYGGNPLACSVAKKSLEVLIKENMINNSNKMGTLFRNGLRLIKSDLIKDIRGVGLFNAIEFNEKEIAEKLTKKLQDNGLLTKTTHDVTIRLCPPLVINRKEIEQSLDIIEKSLNQLH